MLQSMRDGAKSWIMKTIFMGLLAFATAGLVLMDMGNFFTGGLVAPTVAFEIDGEEYPMAQLDQQISRALQENGLTLSQGIQAGIVNRIIDSEVENYLLRKEAKRLDISISDEVVAKHTKEMLDGFMQAYGDTGQGSDELRRALFNRLLTQTGLSEAGFVALQKVELANTLVSASLTKTSPSVEIIEDMLLQHNAERRDAETYYITVKDSEIKKATDEELTALYNERKEAYRVPEYRSFNMARLTLENVGKQIDISDELVNLEYEDRIANGDYTTPATATFSQISFETQEEANSFLKEIKQKGSLEKAAKDQAAYIESKEYQAGELLDELATSLFSSTKKGLRGPIETDLGWVIADIEKISLEKVDPLKAVKASIVDDLRFDRASEEIYKLSYALEDSINAGASLKEISDEMGLDFSSVALVDIAGNGFNKNKDFNDETIPASMDVLDAVFTTDEETATPLLETAQGDFIIAYVEEVKPSYVPEQADLSKDLNKDWKETQRAKLTRQKAEDFIEKVRKDQKRPKFKQHKKQQRLSYNGDVKNSLDDIAVTALFQLKKIGEMTSVPYKKGQLVIRYKNSSLDKKTKSSEFKGSLKRDFEQTILADYFSHLRKDADIDINYDGIDRYYATRLEQNY